MAHGTDWDAVTRFFDGVIEETENSRFPDHATSLTVQVYSEALGKTLIVRIPTRKVEDFMKALPLFEARVIKK
jgi:hypothetical protein